MSLSVFLSVCVRLRLTVCAGHKPAETYTNANRRLYTYVRVCKDALVFSYTQLLSMNLSVCLSVCLSVFLFVFVDSTTWPETAPQSVPHLISLLLTRVRSLPPSPGSALPPPDMSSDRKIIHPVRLHGPCGRLLRPNAIMSNSRSVKPSLAWAAARPDYSISNPID